MTMRNCKIYTLALTFSISSDSSVEEGEDIVFTVTLSVQADRTVSVPIQLNDDTTQGVLCFKKMFLSHRFYK